MSTPLERVILHPCGVVIKTEEEKAAHQCSFQAKKPDTVIVDEEVEAPDDHKTRCEHCGAQMKEWKNNFTPGLAAALKTFAYAVRSANKNDVAFKDVEWESFTQRQNFQKLRYWGLIAHVRDHGEKVWGRWLLTRRGGQFLRGELSIPFQITTYRNRITKRSDDFVNIREVEKNTEPLDYYQREFAFEPHITMPEDL